ncbi:MAG: response regulator [Planctomycetota bacterium]|nr:response regulator [Planctomycetota bacterium]
MPEEQIKALLIEDSEADYALIKEYVSSSINTSFELERADRLSKGIGMLANTHYDVALLDLSLPDSSGMETVTRFREQIDDVPVVVMSGLLDENIAIQCVQQGAQDYLVKTRMSTEAIVRAVKYAIQRHRIQSGIERGKKEYDSGEYGVAAEPDENVAAAGDEKITAAGNDLFGIPTAEISLEETSLSSFGSRLALIFRTCKKGNKVSSEVITLQLKGIAQSLKAMQPNGSDVIAVIKRALQRENISALDVDVIPICFELFSMMVTQYWPEEESG